ncbi:MAG: hypothetical protein ABIQ04_03470 [Candidatus Saccharimonadales bacterium]
MEKNHTTELGQLLEQASYNIASYDQLEDSSKHEQTVHVQNVANALLFAYEQLRNASENIEDHLLVQKAILRFYRRNLSFTTNKMPTGLGTELIIELTQVEYLQNDTIPLSSVTKMDEMITSYYELFWMVRKQYPSLPVQRVEKWILEILSVKSEQIFNNPIRILSFARFAHSHFTKLISYDHVITSGTPIEKADYPTLLYISIHKALLKSDDANVRSELQDLYAVLPTAASQFVEFNTKYDNLVGLDATTKLSRLILKNAAPLKIIRSTFFDSKEDYRAVDLSKKDRLTSAINTDIDMEYQSVRKSVNVGIVKSIIFLLITKALIGLLIEIPYDMLLTGSIVIVPLLINLLFPPVFLAVTALTFKLPGDANKLALATYIQSMLYDEPSIPRPTLKYTEPVSNTPLFNILYVAVFIGAFYLVGSRLAALNFNLAQGFIFFIFLSTASFLGYRLTLQIKELELINTSQGFIALIRDFLYAPFIFLGKRISYRFGQLNLIAQILDTVIDLPLKTTVRLVRQWMIFLNNKKDELL